MARIRYFAAAAEAAGRAAEEVEAATLGELCAVLVAAHGDGFARVLARCAVLVDGQNTDAADTSLAGAATVDVLPPFAGG